MSATILMFVYSHTAIPKEGDFVETSFQSGIMKVTRPLGSGIKYRIFKPIYENTIEWKAWHTLYPLFPNLIDPGVHQQTGGD